MSSQKFSLKLAEKNLEVEFRKLAEQANGDVLVRSGDTLLLTACVMGKQDRDDLGFFPLTVGYEEKYYAVGKIKGPRYIKREGRPSDEAICNARLIDRAIRPRFPKDLSREVQVITTVLSWDGQNDPDVLALLAASLALSTSDIPWLGPISTVRVCRVKGKFILNPTQEEKEGCDLELVLAGVLKEDGCLLINMIEGNSEGVEEDLILDALEYSEKYLKKLIDFQKEISKKIGKEKIILETSEPDAALEKEIREFLGDNLEKAFFQKDNNKRDDEVDKLKEELAGFIEKKYSQEEKIKYAREFFEKEIDRLFRENILKHDKRPDGRKLDELRKIHCEVGLLPRTHGSSLFCRGKTKALSILTLGAPGDRQLLEGMEIVDQKRFMHHYNFPSYSAGEVKPIRGPGRREIGHGMLVEKALLPLICSFEEFPYTIRIVTEIVSSNGSTSMASVSSSSLALMDAGVSVIEPAAGIAMGLIQDEETGNYKILTDIQGPEDHYGDMDFKIAGTRKGITVLQMDVKIEGLTKKIIKEALFRAKKTRLEILDSMGKVLAESRPQLSSYAPRVLTIQIDPEKIREVIGPGGKIINEIIEKTGAAIDIQETGLIFVTSEEEDSAKKAISWIKNITREVKVREVFEGKVKRILDFGAFVEILPGQEGLIHISKLSSQRVEKVEDVVKIGDMVRVQVISVDEQGRINLVLLKK